MKFTKRNFDKSQHQW